MHIFSQHVALNSLKQEHLFFRSAIIRKYTYVAHIRDLQTILVIKSDIPILY